MRHLKTNFDSRREASAASVVSTDAGDGDEIGLAAEALGLDLPDCDFEAILAETEAEENLADAETILNDSDLLLSLEADSSVLPCPSNSDSDNLNLDADANVLALGGEFEQASSSRALDTASDESRCQTMDGCNVKGLGSVCEAENGALSSEEPSDEQRPVEASVTKRKDSSGDTLSADSFKRRKHDEADVSAEEPSVGTQAQAQDDEPTVGSQSQTQMQVEMSQEQEQQSANASAPQTSEDSDRAGAIASHQMGVASDQAYVNNQSSLPNRPVGVPSNQMGVPNTQSNLQNNQMGVPSNQLRVPNDQMGAPKSNEGMVGGPNGQADDTVGSHVGVPNGGQQIDTQPEAQSMPFGRELNRVGMSDEEDPRARHITYATDLESLYSAQGYETVDIQQINLDSDSSMASMASIDSEEARRRIPPLRKPSERYHRPGYPYSSGYDWGEESYTEFDLQSATTASVRSECPSCDDSDIQDVRVSPPRLIQRGHSNFNLATQAAEDGDADFSPTSSSSDSDPAAAGGFLDPELGAAAAAREAWSCATCDTPNPFGIRFCGKCWKVRRGWVPERKRPRRRNRKSKNGGAGAKRSKTEQPRAASSSATSGDLARSASQPQQAGCSSPSPASSPNHEVPATPTYDGLPDLTEEASASSNSAGALTSNILFRLPSTSHIDVTSGMAPASIPGHEAPSSSTSDCPPMSATPGMGPSSTSQCANPGNLFSPSHVVPLMSNPRHVVPASPTDTSLPSASGCVPSVSEFQAEFLRSLYGISAASGCNREVPSVSSSEAAAAGPPVVKGTPSASRAFPSLALNRSLSSAPRLGTAESAGLPSAAIPLRSMSLIELPSDPTPSTSTVYFPAASSSSSSSVTSTSETCHLCLLGPKDAGFVHGRLLHVVCCYACAKKIVSSGQPCPVCRRRVEKIVKVVLV